MWFNLTDEDVAAIESPVRNARRLYDLLLRIRRERERQERPDADDYRNTAVQGDDHLQDDAAHVVESSCGLGAWVMQWRWVPREEAIVEVEDALTCE